MLFVIDKRERLRAAFAKPIVLDALSFTCRIRSGTATTPQSVIGPKPEKLTAPGPLKSSGTGRICAFRMLLLIKRSPSGRCSAIGGRLFLLTPFRAGPLFFQASDGRPQPASDHLFDFHLVPIPIERIQRFTRRVEWDVTAGDLLGAEFRRHELNQDTIRAWHGIFRGIEIHAGWGVFENKLRSPYGPWRTPIAPIFKKFKFGFQDFQEVALIFLHFCTAVIHHDYELARTRAL